MTLLQSDIPSIEMLKVMIFHFSIKKEDSHIVCICKRKCKNINFGVSASHLLSASVMSAPAALAFSKLTYPETKKSKTTAEALPKIESKLLFSPPLFVSSLTLAI